MKNGGSRKWLSEETFSENSIPRSCLEISARLPFSRPSLPMDELDLPDWLTGADSPEIDFAVTRPTTRFEEACLRGHRASQLEKGAKPKARGVTNTPLDIARAELTAGVPLGMTVLRHCPNGTTVVHDNLQTSRLRVRHW